jgi:hypothetical protein
VTTPAVEKLHSGPRLYAHGRDVEVTAEQFGDTGLGRSPQM